jgi:pimeloyl-ACP methyl ester carboxylesterase
MQALEVPGGVIRYREVGSGPPLVFVHPFLCTSTHWRKLTPLLSARYRCLLPDWPLGAHSVPFAADADLSPRGIARLVLAFLERLDLRDVTLVGNDSGGAIAQLATAEDARRIGRLVLCNCDAFEVFPPAEFGYLKWLGRIPGAMFATTRLMRRFLALARNPLAFGGVVREPIPDEVLREYLSPGATIAGVRRDTRKLIAGVDPALTMWAAEELRGFRGQVLLAWGTDDRFFPLRLAERLRDTIPAARLEPIADCRAFVPEDQPERLAQVMGDFLSSPRPRA